MSTIIDSITQAITAKLVANADFAKKIVNSFLENGLVKQIKQEIYESCHMEVQQAAENANLMTKCITQLEAEKINVENNLDALEQYSQRNCVIVHSMPACDDPENAVIKLFSETLGILIERDATDRCHRLGAAQ